MYGHLERAKMMRALPREILSGHIIYPPAPLNYSNWPAREVMLHGLTRTDALLS
jgi:hypothetical protein